jgi:hypothetical protein
MLVWVLVVVLLITSTIKHSRYQIQSQSYVATGGDPYAWIRPWIIIDFLRNFYFTR